MPLLYGERTKAFQRLQEEIMKTSADHTLFSWGREPGTLARDGFEARGLLASGPYDFVNCKDVCQFSPNKRKLSPYTMTNTGIQICLPWLPLENQENHAPLSIVALNYTVRTDKTAHGTRRKCAALPLRWDMKRDTYHRLGRERPLLISHQLFGEAQIKSMYVSDCPSGLDVFLPRLWLQVPVSVSGDDLNYIPELAVYPPEWTYVREDAKSFQLYRPVNGRSYLMVAKISESSKSSVLFKVEFLGRWDAPRIQVSLGHIADSEPESLVEYALQNGGEIDGICQWQNEIRVTKSVGLTQVLRANVEKADVRGWKFTVQLKLDTDTER